MTLWHRPLPPSSAIRYGAAILSALVLSLVSPPVSWAWLHWVSFVPVFLAVHDLERRQAFRVGYACGFTAVFTLFHWLAVTINVFGDIPLPISVAILVLFASVFGLPYGLLLQFLPAIRRRFGVWWIPLFACVWVMGERLQPALFPYYQGVGQYRSPWVWQLASLIGSMGVSFLVIVTNGCVTELVLSRGRSWRPLAIATVLFASNLVFGANRHARLATADEAARKFRVSILQQGVTMQTRLYDRGETIVKSWFDITRKVAPDHPELVVWPEGAFYYNPTDKQLQPHLRKLAKNGNFALLLGAGTHVENDDGTAVDWNSAYLFDHTGEIAGRYDKLYPLPFGEYMPWPTSYLRPYIAGVGEFRAGTALHVFDVGGVRFSTPICYEAILDSVMRPMGDDADLYINITNDAWFGDTSAPHQHAMLAAAQAMQNGRPMLRIAYTGISMVVTPNGDISHYSTPFTEVAEVAEIPIAPVETPYRRGGWLFPWFCVVVGAGVIYMVWRDRGVTPPASPA